MRLQNPKTGGGKDESVKVEKETKQQATGR